MEGAFRDLHLGIMSTFVNVKIVRFAVIVNKDRNRVSFSSDNRSIRGQKDMAAVRMQTLHQVGKNFIRQSIIGTVVLILQYNV